MVSKVCTKCSVEKPLEQFAKQSTGKYGRRAACKSCVNSHQKDYMKEWNKNNPGKQREYQKKYRLQKQYGISVEDYSVLLASQGGKCAICLGGLDKCAGNDHFYVDHCHQTGHVRGLLCHQCNCAIGLLKDNPELCRKAAEYLEETSCLTTMVQ